MTIHHFFVEAEKVRSPLVILYGREHHHLAHVLRLKRGEKVRIFNERGEVFSALIERIEPERSVLRLEARIQSERILVPLTVAQACLKARMMDWLIGKMTELRVARIVPLITRRTIARLEAGAGQKIKRWQRLALESAKQSQSSLIPEISPPLKVEDFIFSCQTERKYFLSEHGGELLRDILSLEFQVNPVQRPASIAICAGPEGGWTREEEELFRSRGFVPVSLGSMIYRAETAMFMATSILSHFWNA